MRQDVEADPPNLIKGYDRVMLRPMEKEEFDEVVELYKQIFNLR